MFDTIKDCFRKRTVITTKLAVPATWVILCAENR